MMLTDEEDQILDEEDPDLEDEDADADDDEPEDEAPELDIKALMARVDATETANKQLRESVARFQSLLTKIPQNVAPDNKQTEALQTSMDEVFDLLDVLASGTDEALLDPTVKQRVTSVVAQRRAARDRAALEASMRNMVREIAGPRPAQSAATMESLQSQVDALEAELVAEIQDHGLEPGDFDWDAASKVLGESGPAGLKKHIRDAIRAKLTDDSRAARRQSRKTNAGKSPRGGAPSDSGAAVLKGNDLDAKRAYLRSLGLTGV